MKKNINRNSTIKAAVVLAITMALIMPATAILTSENITDTTEKLNDTITVDDDGGADYTKIQDAINASTDGDTIFVYNGVYNENITINKGINLIGESREGAVIEWEPVVLSAYIVHVTADDVIIDSFTIRDPIFFGKQGNGVCFDNVNGGGSNNILKNCTIFQCYNGIQFGKDVVNNKIINCEISDMIYGPGIEFGLGSSENMVIDCKIHGMLSGIDIGFGSSYNKVVGCEIFENMQKGIYISGDYNEIINCHIHNNSIYGSTYGLGVGGRFNIIHHNSFTNHSHAAYGNVHAGELTNYWDDGFEGNYWDDWADNPGYPDTYEISFNNVDNHPLDAWILAPPQVTVVYPNEVEEILGGEIEILWSEVVDVIGETIEGAEISIEYNVNGGDWEPIESGLDDTGSYLWDTFTFPGLIDHTRYLIRISAAYDGKTGFDTSDDKFALDVTDPTANISRPIKGDILLGDSILLNLAFLNSAIILGKVTAIADAQDEMSGVEYVHFELSSGETFDDFEAPYSWSVNVRAIGKVTLTVTSVDNVGRSSELDSWSTMDLFIINLLGG